VVIANAADGKQLQQLDHLPLRKIRGQISRFAQTPQSPALRCLVCAEGYIPPAQDGFFCTGATFHPDDPDTSIRPADHQTNLDNLCEHLPDFAGKVDVTQLDGRVAYRCSLPDYLPCVGPAPAVEPMLARFERMRKNARAGFTQSGAYLPGLYVNLGQGARGLAYTPLCAELLAAQINNEPWPIARELGNALNPARFLIRDLARNKR
jgi:tRNA 5-methylaminomethyl-2-thiouridine biosynthesis bifunctional protein